MFDQLTILDFLYPNTDFLGLHFAITGILPFPRSHLIDVILANGGVYDSSVTLHTDYLILGVLRLSSAIPDGISRKLRRAEQLQARGKQIQIVQFEDFLNLWKEEKES